MTPAIITSTADQTNAQAGFIVQNVTTATDNPSMADNQRGVELTQALVQTDLSIPVPTGELTRESLASANIQGMYKLYFLLECSGVPNDGMGDPDPLLF